MATATLFALLCHVYENCLVFRNGPHDLGAVAAGGEAGKLDKPGRLHVTGSVGHSMLEYLLTVLELERP